MSNLSTTIQQAAEKSKQTVEQIEKELISYLGKKYSADNELDQKIDKLVLNGKHRIIGTLYNSTECKISEGWNHLKVVSDYKTLLWWALGQNPVYQGELFERVVKELLEDELIYTRTFTGDNVPKEVGLTDKGKMYWATENMEL